MQDPRTPTQNLKVRTQGLPQILKVEFPNGTYQFFNEFFSCSKYFIFFSYLFFFFFFKKQTL